MIEVTDDSGRQVMRDDFPVYEDLSDQDKNAFLIRKGLPFLALGWFLLLLSILLNITGNVFLELLVDIAIAVSLVYGLVPSMFWSKNRKKEYISDELWKRYIEVQKQAGATDEELDRLRFQNDPVFRDNVINEVHRKADKEYEDAVLHAKKRVTELERRYKSTYKQFKNQCRQEIGGSIINNARTGVITFKGREYPYTSIRGAEMNCVYGTKTEHVQRMVTTTEEGKEKRNLSVGGAIAGGIIAGPIGAVAGAVAFGKTTKEPDSTHTSTYVEERHEPSCDYLSVKINLDGFISEEVFISSQVSQNSQTYRHYFQEAQGLVSALRMLAATEVPETVLPIEEEPVLIQIQEDLNKAKQDLEAAKAATPAYEIPARYLDPSEGNEEDEEEVNLFTRITPQETMRQRG